MIEYIVRKHEISDANELEKYAQDMKENKFPEEISKIFETIAADKKTAVSILDTLSRFKGQW